MSAPRLPRGPDHPGAPEIVVVLSAALLGLGLLWLTLIKLVTLARWVAGWVL